MIIGISVLNISLRFPLLFSAPVTVIDFSRPFIIQCDASDRGFGAVLYQECGGAEHYIAHGSKGLTKAESATEKDLIDVLFGIEKLKTFIEGTHITIETDHSSLIWLTNSSNPSGPLTKWASKAH